MCAQLRQGIKEVLFAMGRGKASRTDEVLTEIYKYHWETVQINRYQRCDDTCSDVLIQLEP